MRVAEAIPADDALTTLIHRFELPLLQYAARILGDRDRARDVVQETFVEWKRMTYLDEEILEKAPGQEPMPNESMERAEAAGFLLRIVATLPTRQQEVLQLKFQNDLSYQEISEITQLSISHVGVLLHTALKTLRERHRHTARDFLPFNTRLAS